MKMSFPILMRSLKSSTTPLTKIAKMRFEGSEVDLYEETVEEYLYWCRCDSQ
jgi:hypothetical protein